MRGSLQRWLERNFNLALVASFAFGLYLPGIERLPATAVLWLLAIVIFLSAFKMRLAEIRGRGVGSLLFFYVARFVVFPCLLFGAAERCLPAYAMGLFLLALMPPGVSSPAFSGLLGGNISLALVLVVLSTLCTPFVIPLVFAGLTSSTVSLDLKSLFFTLLLTVLLPLGLHLPFRQSPRARRWVEANGPALTVIMIAGTLVLGIAKRRDFIFAHTRQIPEPLAVATGAYLLFYLLGWLMVPRATRADRIAYSICSGANNITLSVSLALLYFPPAISVFTVLGWIPWVFGLMPLKAWLRRATR